MGPDIFFLIFQTNHIPVKIVSNIITINTGNLYGLLLVIISSSFVLCIFITIKINYISASNSKFLIMASIMTVLSKQILSIFRDMVSL